MFPTEKVSADGELGGTGTCNDPSEVDIAPEAAGDAEPGGEGEFVRSAIDLC